MQVEKKPERVSELMDNVRRRGKSIGLVPTMGYLHKGHASLIRRARTDCEYAVVSIFVNPTQFGPEEDFERYPRDLDADLALCRELGVDLVFNPTAELLYPSGYGTFIDVGPIGEVLEGAFRPGHFRGVATVVVKLLNITRPQRAYFGQKDAQQAVIVNKVVRELNLPVEILVCPTVREADGLAVSSRNVYLSSEERRQATVLYRALLKARELIQAGETDPATIINGMEKILAVATDAVVDYISINHPVTLKPVKKIRKSVLASLAVRIGRTRLIDNLIINAPG